MKYVLAALVLLASLGWAQQTAQPTPGANSPPYGTPPTFPDNNNRAPSQEMPPDQQAPPPRAMSTMEVQQQIQQHLDSEPKLRNLNIHARADENTVTLTGTVNSESQHDLALRVADSYANNRKIVDKIKVHD